MSEICYVSTDLCMLRDVHTGLAEKMKYCRSLIMHFFTGFDKVCVRNIQQCLCSSFHCGEVYSFSFKQGPLQKSNEDFNKSLSKRKAPLQQQWQRWESLHATFSKQHQQTAICNMTFVRKVLICDPCTREQ